jgi:hypothetical protein
VVRAGVGLLKKTNVPVGLCAGCETTIGTGAGAIMGTGAGAIMGRGTGAIMGTGAGAIMGTGAAAMMGAGVGAAAGPVGARGRSGATGSTLDFSKKTNLA